MLLLLAGIFPAKGQLICRDSSVHLGDSVKKELKTRPFLTPYKDNYFVLGTALNEKPDNYNSNVKFQISVAFRIAKGLPLNSFLSITYTQLTIWDVFQRSLPMRDLNFNPGLSWTTPWYHGDRFIGTTSLILEHESNGRDGDKSRSWNRIAMSGSLLLTDNVILYGKIWIPIIDSQNNRDILKYRGIGQLGAEIQTFNKRCTFDVMFEKGTGKRFNTAWEFSWRVGKRSNLCLFTQFYSGYGECLLNYNEYHCELRTGISFRPSFLTSHL